MSAKWSSMSPSWAVVRSISSSVNASRASRATWTTSAVVMRSDTAARLAAAPWPGLAVVLADRPDRPVLKDAGAVLSRAMATVTFAGATRTYSGLDHPAVDHLDLEIADGEFLVLVGPSGCGKSTTLRMLAGLEPVDEGTIHIGDRDVTDVPPKDRDIAMVFQSYALYPHMTVAENIGFHLKVKRIPKAERDRRVREAAAVLDLERLPRPQAGQAVGRPAPAGRHGPGDRARAAGVPDGRAAVQPRRPAARPDPHPDRRPAAPPRRDDRVRHPRPGRGDDDGRPRRRPRPRRAAAVRLAEGPLHRPGQPLRRRVHRLAADEPAGGHRRRRRGDVRRADRAADARAARRADRRRP